MYTLSQLFFFFLLSISSSILVEGNLNDFFRLTGFPAPPSFPGPDLYRTTNLSGAIIPTTHSASVAKVPPPRRNPGSGRNYTYSSWSDFSECDKVCGGGYAQRSRICRADDGSQVSVTYCDQTRSSSAIAVLRKFLNGDSLTEIERISCNIQPCGTSNWSEWTACSFPCGGGVQTSSRTCTDAPDVNRCNVQLVRSRRCETQSCFQLSDWGEWGRCSRKCQGGDQTRYRRCQPNLYNDHPFHPILLRILGQFQSFASFRVTLPANPTVAFYLAEYRRACAFTTSDRRRCNTQSCPACPENQIYHHCKSCVRRCERLDSARFYSRVEGISGLLTGARQCIQQIQSCEPGCGCPLLYPYLGSDQRCYLFQQACPINQVNRGNANGAGSEGRSFQTTIGPSPVTLASTTLPTTTTTLPTSTSTLLTTTTTETTSSSSTEEASATIGPVFCDYDVIVATAPGHTPCVCVGNLIQLQCFHDERTSCPVMCTEVSE